MLLQRVDALLVELCGLVVETLRCLGHRSPVLAQYLIDPSAEQPHYLLYHRGVVLLRDAAHAAAPAAAEMEVEAGAELVAQHGVGSYLVVAGAYGVVRPEEFQQGLGVHHRTIGAEIAGAVAHQLPGQEDLGELVGGHAYPGVGLGVLEQDVVAGFVLLDQIVLEQQGVSLGVDDRILHVGYLRHQHPGLGREPGGVGEILGDPLVEVLGLAYINDRSLGVVITVDSGGMRQQGYFLSNVQEPRLRQPLWPLRAGRA